MWNYPFFKYFLGLAIFDSLVISAVVLLKGVPSVAESSYQVNIFQLLYPCMNISWTSSIYLTILLSFERFLGICYPNVAREFCTLKKTMIYIIATFTFSCVYNIPRFIEYELTNVLARTSYDPGGFHLQLFLLKAFWVHHRYNLTKTSYCS